MAYTRLDSTLRGLKDQFDKGLKAAQAKLRAFCRGFLTIASGIAYDRWQGEVARRITDHDIRQRAHRLWEAAGKPECHDTRFWDAAKQELVHGDTDEADHP